MHVGAMSKEFVPFDAKPLVVVSGGYLGAKGQWVPELKTIDGYEDGFLMLRKEDRGLAAAMGRNCSDIRPFHTVSVFSHIAKQRGDVVDELIRAHNAASDPVAEVDNGEVRIKNRGKAFSDANIREVVAITIAATTTPFGKRLDPITLNVVSTPRWGVNPCIVMNTAVLEWLAYVMDCAFESKPARVYAGRDLGFELPELPKPCKYRKRGSAISIACTYTDDEGREKTHQDTITNQDVNQAQFEVLLPMAIERVQQFVDEHNNSSD